MKSSKLLSALLALSLCITLLSGCEEAGGEPMQTVPYVDLERFMGDWYVVANIPTFVEKGAHNPIESYALNPDGTIATTFTFNKDALDGPKKNIILKVLCWTSRQMHDGACNSFGLSKGTSALSISTMIIN